MTETEQRYAQIVKEALALTWACERLSQYLPGSRFILEADHKPLILLLSTKDLEELPIRVQRFRLRMMRYDYDVVHVPGKELNTADFLSRLPLLKTESDDLQNEVQAYIDPILEHLPATEEWFAEIQRHQEEDQILQKWMRQIKGEKMRKPMSYSDLSVKDGLIMKGKRIVIPETLQQEVLEQLHKGHQGMVKCEERARVSV